MTSVRPQWQWSERAFDHPVRDLRVLETHISWVVLTGDFAYKIKKPVELDFLDYSTLDQRRHYCELELELNRRWSPELYLDVVRICGSPDAPLVGGDGQPIEYAVRMKQFPQSAQLDAVLDAGELTEADMDGLAETIAATHTGIPVCDATSGETFYAAIREAMLDNFEHLRDVGDADGVSRLEDWTKRHLDSARETLIARYASGFVRECHGDLHLRNLVRLPSGIVPFDCVEFSEELRTIDVVSDVSFLFMDLISRGEQALAWRFMNRYLECTGDYAGVSVLGLYTVYHALIRAKVAAISAAGETSEGSGQQHREEAEHYCSVALRWIDADAPRLYLMHGFSGSGKTWLSRQLMVELPAVRIRSDIERKRLHGLEESADSGSGVAEGLYAQDTRSAVYGRLAELARAILEAGHNVIVDASFLEREERLRFRALAQRAGVGFVIVSASALQDELERRLVERERASNDASEAGVSVLRYQMDNADAFDADEQDCVVEVATDEPVDVADLVKT